jgi:hypothetical protein
MRWLAVRRGAETWAQFSRAFLAVPRARRARFAWTLTWGWLLLCAASAGAALLLQGAEAERLAPWERPLLQRLVDAAPLDYSLAVFFESPGNGVILLPLTLVRCCCCCSWSPGLRRCCGWC